MKPLTKERQRYFLSLDNRSESSYHLAFSNIEEFDWVHTNYGRDYHNNYFLYDLENYFLKHKKHIIKGKHLN